MPASADSIRIELPHQWRPRGYQEPAWAALERGVRRLFLVWHRRAGKDLFAINWETVASQERVGLYWHVLPTYAQARKTVWDGMTKDGRRFVDHIPSQLVERVRDDEMKIWLRNGSIIQMIGAEDPDRLVGSNPIGVVNSEYAVQNPAFWDFVRPILAENGGWAIFVTTPRGRNHAYRLYQAAKNHPDWFAQILTVRDTNAITQQAIEAERMAGMSDELIQQEFHCSFDLALVGSYYGSHVALARTENRIGEVPYDPGFPVDTGWDLGVSNSTCIWFKQQVGAQRRIIDFYMASGEDLGHYAKVCKEKPYVYGKHYFPHDIEVKELGATQSRKDILRSLGIRATVVPRISSVGDGIEVVRNYLRTCWFDEKKTGSLGIQGLLEYTKKETGQRGPNGEPFYSDDPAHTWASDVADALRTLACGDRGGKFDRRPSEFRGPSPYAKRVAIV